MAALGLDALIAIGGEDTLGVANRLHHDFGLNVVGVPKTIDNDLSGTDYTFGFWTAVQIAVDAIDRLTTTAESHDRVIVVEVMGRHAGWIALGVGTRRRRRRDPDPRAPPADPTASSHICASARPAASTSPSSSSARACELGQGTVDRRARRVRTRSPGGQAGVGERLAELHRRRAPARRRAPSCSATCSAAARRPPTTGSLATRFGIHAARMVDDGALRPDGRPARCRDRRRADRRGRGHAQDGAAGVVRRRRGLLRLIARCEPPGPVARRGGQKQC